MWDYFWCGSRTNGLRVVLWLILRDCEHGDYGCIFMCIGFVKGETQEEEDLGFNMTKKFLSLVL